MNFTNQHKMYFNVFLLFVFTYLLAGKLIQGFKTQDFNYIRIGINALLIVFTVKNIIKYNVDK
jgi:hypothetical protein